MRHLHLYLHSLTNVKHHFVSILIQLHRISRTHSIYIHICVINKYQIILLLLISLPIFYTSYLGHFSIFDEIF